MSVPTATEPLRYQQTTDDLRPVVPRPALAAASSRRYGPVEWLLRAVTNAERPTWRR